MAEMFEQVLRRGTPIIRLRLPKLKSREIISLPFTTGPLGLVEFKRVQVGELSPFNILPIKEFRERM